MIRSMTGYGRAREGAMTVELRAVNHRYLDVSVRLPRICHYLEDPVKTMVSGHVSRGKIEVSVTVENLYADSTRMVLNRPVLEGYLAAAALIGAEYGLENDLTATKALGLPEVMSAVREDTDAEELTRLVLAVCRSALDDFDGMRAREGARLKDDILEKTAEIERLVADIKARYPAVVEAYRQRLEAKIRETLGTLPVEDARVLTETAIFADKAAVDEEIVRLSSHIASLRGILGGKGPVGRKLDFLVQEFAREANTIGSKCSDVETGKIVVELKAEIEKIREQVQNLE